MKLNEFTVIEGNLVRLIPYEKRHVEKYHQWMLSSELQRLTASDPLPLEQEFEMQKDWRENDDFNKRKYDDSKSEIEAMVGDTNIFLKGNGIAEVAVMIAEVSARGAGLGKEALMLMLQYGMKHLNITTYRAIILRDNATSIGLFNSIGFEKVGENKYFDEVILEKEVSSEWSTWLFSQITFYKEITLRK